MSVLPGATNTTIHNGIFNAVSNSVANIGAQNGTPISTHLYVGNKG